MLPLSNNYLGFHAIPQVDSSRAEALQEGGVHLGPHAPKRPYNGGDVSAVELVNYLAGLGS